MVVMSTSRFFSDFTLSLFTFWNIFNCILSLIRTKSSILSHIRTYYDLLRKVCSSFWTYMTLTNLRDAGRQILLISFRIIFLSPLFTLVFFSLALLLFSIHNTYSMLYFSSLSILRTMTDYLVGGQIVTERKIPSFIRIYLTKLDFTCGSCH